MLKALALSPSVRLVGRDAVSYHVEPFSQKDEEQELIVLGQSCDDGTCGLSISS